MNPQCVTGHSQCSPRRDRPWDTRRVRRILGIVLCSLALLTACGRPPAEPAVAPPPSASTSASPVFPRDEAATHGGDGAPHEAENRGPLQRSDPPPEYSGTATDAAHRIEAALQPLRDRNDFLPAAVRPAIIAAGFGTDKVSTVGMTPAGVPYDAPPIGTSFGVSVAPRTCVVGAIAADRLTVTVAGTSPEYGCLEPKPTNRERGQLMLVPTERAQRPPTQEARTAGVWGVAPHNEMRHREGGQRPPNTVGAAGIEPATTSL